MTGPVAGVDGCPGGWVCVSRFAPDSGPSVEVFQFFSELAASLPIGSAIVVDMPIGFPDRLGEYGRGPEYEVRRRLKKHKSSVFSMPSRAALYEVTGELRNQSEILAGHQRASDVAAKTSCPSKRISIQAFSIFHKIRELDGWLTKDLSRSKHVIESHPEFAFTMLNDGKEMAHKKKIKGRINIDGMEERKQFLASKGFDPHFLNQPVPRGANADDFLDACVMLLIAERHASGKAVPYPSPYTYDSYGLPIAIHA